MKLKETTSEKDILQCAFLATCPSIAFKCGNSLDKFPNKTDERVFLAQRRFCRNDDVVVVNEMFSTSFNDITSKGHETI